MRMYSLHDSKLVDYLMVFRPPLVFLGVLASFSLALYVGKPLAEILLIVGAVGLMNTGYNVMNELMDAETDKRIKGYKPVPRGTVSVKYLYMVSVTLVITGFVCTCVLSYYFDTMYWVFGVICLMGGFVYNHKDYDRALVGNVALGITYGSAAFLATLPDMWLFAVLFGLWTILFNIMVQLQDLEGDKGEVYTVPQQIGETATALTGLVGGGVLFLVFWSYFSLVFVPFVISSLLISVTGFVYLTFDKEKAGVACQWLQRRSGRVFLILGFFVLLFV